VGHRTAMAGGLMSEPRPRGRADQLAAKGIIDVLLSIWPAAEYAQIAGAGHMSALTHAELVNDIIVRFLEKHTKRT
jgi:pimeloyl-ACP methyl ester carboxylesterase